MTACTYLTSESDSNLLMAKSKVTDYKRPTTIPKMEMNAVTIGARLSLNTYLSLRNAVYITKIIILTDSEIVLKWIKCVPNRQNVGPYVKNRVKEIYKIVKMLEEMKVEIQFGYIDSKWNPADIGTRGATSEELLSHIWWKGYPLKSIMNNDFTNTFFNLPASGDEEEHLDQKEVHVATTTTRNVDTKDILDLSRYSSKTKSLRTLAYVLRFLKNIVARVQDPLRSKLLRRLPFLDKGPENYSLTASDIQDAHYVLIRNHQAVHLQSQYRKELSNNLNLKEDEMHLLRAYGRLNQSDLNIEARNPLLVVPNTDLCRLIVEEAHGKYHNSTALTLAEVRGSRKVSQQHRTNAG
ncbi:unnamed protein product [Heligmosomoides polygyrus]|uniref:RNase H domain-containing protein n=1 Tax=Heligmosomoides polygyrus TaxID=6339 RepID=A0A183GEN5_HELPZ|nr:unnamed protein product [Heligmosomoides polygyrus]